MILFCYEVSIVWLFFIVTQIVSQRLCIHHISTENRSSGQCFSYSTHVVNLHVSSFPHGNAWNRRFWPVRAHIRQYTTDHSFEPGSLDLNEFQLFLPLKDPAPPVAAHRVPGVPARVLEGDCGTIFDAAPGRECHVPFRLIASIQCAFLTGFRRYSTPNVVAASSCEGLLMSSWVLNIGSFQLQVIANDLRITKFLLIDRPRRTTWPQMYQIQELNPFLEWHLHATSDDLDQSLVWAQQITSEIARPVRVLDQNARVIAIYNFQSLESWWSGRHLQNPLKSCLACCLNVLAPTGVLTVFKFWTLIIFWEFIILQCISSDNLSVTCRNVAVFICLFVVISQ